MKVKEGQQLKFLTPNTIDVYACKFQSADKFVLFVTFWGVLVPLSFASGANLF